MTDIPNKIELLAPAGSPDSLKAAVASGADAVYLGLDRFNARSNAENFTADNLRTHIEYCRLRGVKTYLALNTILYDDELQAAYETACLAYNAGIDAVILQDMGLMSILKNQLPGLELHASTQTSVNNPAGVEYMASLGFSRVILAREMNLQAISDASSFEISTEVFVHGARCYSYSGQCLMSSMLGGRSGNRGSCAQPCRLPYTLKDNYGNLLLNGHLLSLKDTLYIDSLNLLRDAGVGALKIEGRMKTPEYVAAVVSIYRKYLDMSGEYDISKEDLDDLIKSFNREGFSKGALSAKTGFNEFSRHSPASSGFPVGKVITSNDSGSVIEFTASVNHNDGLKLNADGSFAGIDIPPYKKVLLPLHGNAGDIVYRTKDIQFNKKYALDKVLAGAKKIPLAASATVVLGRKPAISISDSSGNNCEITSDTTPQPAVSGGTSCIRIREQLLKTGGTPFEISELNLECAEGIYIKISDINNLRRKALDTISDIRIGKKKHASANTLSRPLIQNIQADKARYSVCFYSMPENMNFSKLNVERIYVDYNNCRKLLLEISRESKSNGIEFYILLPYSCDTIPDISCDGYLVGNHGMLDKLPLERTVLDSGFNITNPFAQSAYENIESFTFSYEMSQERIKGYQYFSKTPGEMIIYGKPQVMESPYCPARDICSGDLCIRKQLYLTDRKDEEWDVIYNPEEHSVRIFNPHRIMLTESAPFIRESGVSRFRINIMDETANEVYEIIRAANTGKRPRLNPEYNFTRGHY